MITTGEEVMADAPPRVLLGTVTVPRVNVKLAVLNEREASGVDIEVGTEIAVDEATGAIPELKVSMTVKVLVSITWGLSPEVIVVVSMKVDTASTGADGTVESPVGLVETTSVQSTAPGHSRVTVRVPVKGRPEGPSETVKVSTVTMLLASKTPEAETNRLLEIHCSR